MQFQCHSDLSNVANQRDNLQNQSSSVLCLKTQTHTLMPSLCFLNTAEYMRIFVKKKKNTGNDIPLPNPIPLLEVTMSALGCSLTDLT